MLVLSRKLTERIQIGENVFVTVLDVRGSCVRLGIDAPREVPIRRTELPKLIPESPVESAATSPFVHRGRTRAAV